jgi:glycosyltransferase involved in cell wall biosynthesis
MTRPTVTAVIPVRDGADHVARALESVLAQSVTPDVVSVVDDGSSDGTAAVVAAFGPPVALVSTPPRGVAAARNRGIRDATTDAVTFLDADDTWPSGRVERHLAILAADPAVEVVLGATRYFDLSPEERAKYRFAGPEPVAVVMHFGAATVRREVFAEHGLLDESLRSHEDWDWFLRIRERNVRIHVDRDVANEYRRRPGSTSQITLPGDPTRHDILKRSLDRRRAGGGTAAPITTTITPPPQPPSRPRPEDAS